MNAADIDVSGRKSTVAVLRPFGEIVRLPFDVTHNTEGLALLAEYLKALDGETRFVLERTGRYYEPVAKSQLCQCGKSTSHQGVRCQGVRPLRLPRVGKLAAVIDLNHIEGIAKTDDRSLHKIKYCNCCFPYGHRENVLCVPLLSLCICRISHHQSLYDRQSAHILHLFAIFPQSFGCIIMSQMSGFLFRRFRLLTISQPNKHSIQ